MSTDSSSASATGGRRGRKVGSEKDTSPNSDETQITLTTNARDIQSLVVEFLGRGLRSRTGETGAFTLKLDDLTDLHRRITQRVSSQNEFRIVDFYCKFNFTGGSEELLPDEREFLRFRYMGSKACRFVELNYALLVKFPGRDYEKQQITIEVGVNNSVNRRWSIIDAMLGSRPDSGVMSMVVEYTDYSWANDVKNIFEQFIKEKIVTNKPLKWFSQIAWFGTPVTELVAGFAIGIIALAHSLDGAISSVRAQRIELIARSSQTISDIDQKINFILASPLETSLWFTLSLPLSIAVVSACFWLVRGAASTLRPRSYLILNEAHQKIRDQDDRRMSRKATIYLLGAAGAVVIGILSTRLNDILQLIGL